MELKRNLLTLSLFFYGIQFLSAQKNYTLSSPDEKLNVTVAIGQDIKYSVTHDGDIMISCSPISIELTDGVVWGRSPKVKKITTRYIDNQIKSPIYKKEEVRDNFKELAIQFKGNYELIFRAYDDGVAYRFVSKRRNAFKVKSEQAVFNFPADYKAYIPYIREDRTGNFENQFFNSFENYYVYENISKWDKRKYAFSPLLIEAANGKKICLGEADLLNYPGMYLYNKDGSNSLEGVFAPYPKDTQQGGHNNLQKLVTDREQYIATFDKGTSLPWRFIVISNSDYELTNNDMVYKLATPTAHMDFSWVKPGKVIWEWWNDWNLYNVDFKAGINNETYKYYIDFASKHGIEYVIMDEGWAVNGQADLLQVIPEINIKELAEYAQSKNVGLILWAGYYAFDRDMENVCRHYSQMGIKGFKVDFMDRDDQLMVDFHRRAAETGAKYKLMIDFHGTYKPTGLQKTYPNVINFEGVNGLEQLKWAHEQFDQITYDVTFPFIRMLAGPVDYTQGAMRNAAKGNYRSVNNEAMSQGTRCRQLAEYVIFESPLNMLCDSPSNYEQEEECTKFIASIPTVWDKTLSLNGEITKYITIARQKDNHWYIGALTNWNERELELDLSFLGEGTFKAEIFHDGINANKAARDYKREIVTLPENKKIIIKMASGGGWVARIYK